MDTAALHLKITSDGMDKAQQGLHGLENAAGLVESAFKKLVAAAALFKAGSFIGEITQLTARYETLGVVMRVVGNNAGYTGAQMEAYAKGLQSAGISMLESRNTLAMMASAHINLANATKLGRIAQDAAVIGNLNSSESFQRMIYGIQSGQVEILRTIGLNVNFEQSYKKLAAQLGKSAQDLTEVEKVQARTNAVMAKGVDIAGAYEESLGTVGKAAKSMERIWENLQVLLGQVFQAGFTVLIDGMTSAMKSATEWANKNAQALEELGRSIRDVMVAGGEFTKLLADISGGSQGATEGVGFLTSIFRGVSVIIAGTTDVLRAFWGELNAFIGDMLVKVGRVLDLATKFGTLGYFSGDGPVTGAGRAMQAYGAGITAPLASGTATGRTLDGMLASHGTGTGLSFAQEQARIAEAAKRKAEADLAAARAAAAAVSAAGIWTDTRPYKDLPEDLKPIHERSVPDYQVATVQYGSDLKSVKQILAEFRRENVTTWDLVSQAVMSSSRNASDSLVVWMDNLDGVGRSWKTLGDTVKSVLRDMVIQMQRALVQQQLMDPLLKWATNPNTWSWLSGSSGSLSTSGVAPTGWTGMTLPGAAASGPSGPSVAPQIIVNINGTSGKSEISAAQGGQAAADLQKTLEPAFAAWTLKQMRPGGLLAGRA